MYNLKKIKSVKEKLPFFSEKAKFYRFVRHIARKEDTNITRKEVHDIYLEIDAKLEYVKTLIEAEKENAHITTEQAREIFFARKKNNSFKEIISLYIKIKKAKLNFSVEEIVEVYKENKNIPKIISAIINAKKQGVSFSITELKTIFYNISDNKKIVEAYIKSKKYGNPVSTEQIMTAYFENINVEKYINLRTLITKSGLEMSDKLLFSILKENTNFIKTIDILSKEKQECKAELLKLNFIDDKSSDKLANTYTVSGKEKFKKELNEYFIKNKILEDPAQIYLGLVKAPNNSFKYNFETLKPYLSFDFTPNIDVLIGTYLKARKEGLYIKLEQIAELALKEVDVEKFIDAEIKNRKYD